MHDSSIFASYGAVAGRRIRVSSSWAPDTAESGTLTATTFIDARQYIPITRRSNFAFRAFGLTSEGDFPDVTFIGGLDTLRGFRVREFGGFRAFYANAEFRFPLIDVLATPILQFQSVRGVVFFDVGAAWFPDISDFDFYNSDEDRLEDGVAAYGFGFTIRFLGLDLNWDFAKLYDFQDSADGFETSFWIGRRF
ncbi:MAG: BamA/TamA family outer membrane protein [Acidobacteriota bacterium]